MLDDVEHGHQAPISPVFHDSLGNLDEAAFRAFHPVVGGLLQDFITMACILIYYDAVIQSWPNSQALDGLALQAIDMILQAHARDSRVIREACKFSLFIYEEHWHSISVISTVSSGLTMIIAKWVSAQIRNHHLEEILTVARSYMEGFNLGDSHGVDSNRSSFRAATFLSAYLHLFHSPTGDNRVSLNFHYIVCH